MKQPWMTEGVIDYLTAKEWVDAVSLHPSVWRRVVDWLSVRGDSLGNEPFHMLELGAGRGGLAELILRRKKLPAKMHCTFVDVNRDVLLSARHRLVQKFALNSESAGVSFDPSDDSTINLRTPSGSDVTARFLRADMVDPGLPTKLGGQRADLVIAHSVLDLVPLHQIVERIEALLATGGRLYAPVTFNGMTRFLPSYLDPELEETFIQAYHKTIDERAEGSGGSNTGRVLLTMLRERGWQELIARPSDWLLSGDGDAQERTFIRTILRFFHENLSRREGLDEKQLKEWLDYRCDQLSEHVLLLHIHNLDIFARWPK